MSHLVLQYPNKAGSWKRGYQISVVVETSTSTSITSLCKCIYIYMLTDIMSAF